MNRVAVFILGGLLFAQGALAADKKKAAPTPTPKSKTPAFATRVSTLRVEDFAPVEKSRSERVLKVAGEAIAAFARNDLVAARAEFKKLLEIDPENITGLVNLGTVEYRLTHPEVATALLEKALRIEPRAAPAWLTLGVIRYEQGNLDAALAALSQAAWLDPKNPLAHSYLGVTVGSKGWYLGAEEELRRAVELDPNYAEAHFNLALFYLRRSPPAVELARRHYQQARDLGAAPEPLVEKQLRAN